MAFDFKKEYKAFYLPPRQPQILTAPAMQYAAVDGKGDPNMIGGAYQRAVGALYALAYTVKMSKMGDHRMAGYFDFVVPPLEGLWHQEEGALDLGNKAAFCWTAMLRLPDFVTEEEFTWARAEAERKKKADFSALRLMQLSEGPCVQMLHVGPYDGEAASIARMEAFVQAQGYRMDLTKERRHHEIYLTDPRKTQPEKWRTVIRLPVARREKGEE